MMILRVHRNWLFALISILTLILIVGQLVLRIETGSMTKPLPVEILSCLPSQAVKTDLSGEVKDKNNNYYLVGTSLPNQNSEESKYREMLIQVNRQGTCLSLLPDKEYVLSRYITVRLARQLALQNYQKTIHQMGQGAFQAELSRQLNNYPDSMKAQLPKEYIWALKQLGIELPQNGYKVLN
ncbi:MAG: hypothetical protein AAFV90_25260 [Cyanobacteria bacterium J06634_5]